MFDTKMNSVLLCTHEEKKEFFDKYAIKFKERIKKLREEKEAKQQNA